MLDLNDELTRLLDDYSNKKYIGSAMENCFQLFSKRFDWLQIDEVVLIIEFLENFLASGKKLEEVVRVVEQEYFETVISLILLNKLWGAVAILREDQKATLYKKIVDNFSKGLQDP